MTSKDFIRRRHMLFLSYYLNNLNYGGKKSGVGSDKKSGCTS